MIGALPELRGKFDLLGTIHGKHSIKLLKHKLRNDLLAAQLLNTFTWDIWLCEQEQQMCKTSATIHNTQQECKSSPNSLTAGHQQRPVQDMLERLV